MFVGRGSGTVNRAGRQTGEGRGEFCAYVSYGRCAGGPAAFLGALEDLKCFEAGGIHFFSIRRLIPTQWKSEKGEQN